MFRSLLAALVASLCCLATSNATSAEFFVASDGRDTASGDQTHPFATIERARQAVRELAPEERRADGGVTVWIEPGRYELDQPIRFDAGDSGVTSAPIVYRARRRGTVRISGGRQITGWHAVTDAKVFDRVDAALRDHLLAAELTALGIEDLGKVTVLGQQMELFFGDRPMTLARWPNEGFVKIARVVGKTPHAIHGNQGTKEGDFVYEGDRPARWVREPEGWLHGYWFWDWSDSYERIASIDPAERLLHLAAPYHGYGYRKGQRYYALNLLSELDRPGEYYVDRKSGTLYFWPPSPIDGAEAVVSLAPHLLRFKGTSHIVLRDLIFEASRSTAISVQEDEGLRIVGCTLRNLGTNAVSISGGRDHAVVACDIYQTGAGGVSLSGGDRRTLTSAGHRAENNDIHHFARLKRTYAPALSLSGVGCLVRHNRLHDAPHTALLFSGNDHVIELTEIHDVCRETGDVGAIYTGRDWTARGHLVRHNYFHHIRGPGLYGAMAVYLDDAASGITVQGNIFFRAGRAAFIGGGRDNLVDGNLFVDCHPAVHVDARGIGWMRSTVQTTLPERLAAVPYQESPWKERYPQLLTLLDDEPGVPKGNRVRRNVVRGGQWLGVEDKARPWVRFEDNRVDENASLGELAREDARPRADDPRLGAAQLGIPAADIGLIVDKDGRRVREPRHSRPSAGQP